MSGISGPGKSTSLARILLNWTHATQLCCLGTGKSTLFALSCSNDLHTINDWQSWPGKINLIGSYLVIMGYTLLMIDSPCPENQAYSSCRLVSCNNGQHTINY